jgi:hypothetical protein
MREEKHAVAGGLHFPFLTRGIELDASSSDDLQLTNFPQIDRLSVEAIDPSGRIKTQGMAHEPPPSFWMLVTPVA